MKGKSPSKKKKEMMLMVECIFCIHFKGIDKEDYCPYDGQYHWEYYEYCTYHEGTLEDLDIYRGAGCEHYQGVNND